MTKTCLHSEPSNMGRVRLFDMLHIALPLCVAQPRVWVIISTEDQTRSDLCSLLLYSHIARRPRTSHHTGCLCTSFFVSRPSSESTVFKPSRVSMIGLKRTRWVFIEQLTTVCMQSNPEFYYDTRRCLCSPKVCVPALAESVVRGVLGNAVGFIGKSGSFRSPCDVILQAHFCDFKHSDSSL